MATLSKTTKTLCGMGVSETSAHCYPKKILRGKHTRHTGHDGRDQDKSHLPLLVGLRHVARKSSR